ncbi:MAG: FAD binding domain-containing protein [Acidimicrobiales bacterium]
MPSVLAYHRPGSLDEATTLLAGPNRRALGGGTVVVPAARRDRGDGIEVVDLQGLDLAGVAVDGDRLDIGAMVRLGDLVTDDRIPALLRDLARRELPSALRNQATVGGTVALGEADSVLLAGLIVHDARVALHGQDSIAVGQSLAECVGQRLVTSISVAVDGHGAIAATGRTPADVPIVAAVARRSADDQVRLALTGVGPYPVEVDPADPTAGLAPTGDFRGSADYRIHLAGVLSARVLEELGR